MLKNRIVWTIILLFMIQIRCAGKTNPELLPGPNAFLGNNYLTVVAHQDDDLLFMNPDIVTRIQRGCRMTTVYITAGDKHKLQQYWLAREAGVKEAYAYMAKVANEWVEEDFALDNHELTRFILRQNPKISLVFLRLPDGIDIRQNEVTLKTIWQYDQVVIYSRDQKNWYRKYDLVKVLKTLMDYYQPEVIEYVYPGNHVDHQYVAKFAALAERVYQRNHMVIRYWDYNISKYPPNLDRFDTQLKWLIAQRYGKYDKYFPKYGFERMFYRYYGWCKRQYYYENRKDETGEKFPLSVALTKKLNSLWLYRPVIRPKLAPLLKK